MNFWDNLKKAHKSSEDKMVGGVCGGLGDATPIPAWMWRAGFLFSILAFGVGAMLYLVLLICLPDGDMKSA